MSNPTPGGNLVGLGATIGMWVASAFMAVTALVLGIGTIALDLSLGPQFMSAYAEQNGSPAFWMTQVIPWSFSVATTGFQYMLYRGYTQGRTFRNSDSDGKIAIAAGWFVGVLDTTTDVAGLTSYLYGPEVGVGVYPADFPPAWMIMAAMVALFCGLQEYLLVPLLHSGSDATRGMAGSILVEGAVTIVGWIFNILRATALAFAVASILVLDVMLTWYFVRVQLLESGGVQSGTFSWAVSGFISIAVTGVQVLLFRRKKMGDITWKSKWMYVAGILTVLDTASDIGGFTTLMYGPSDGFNIIPKDAPLAWWLIALTIAGLCYFYEFMMSTMVDGGSKGGGMSMPRPAKASAPRPAPMSPPPMPGGMPPLPPLPKPQGS